eukprot:SAG11_NODE_771_length_7253_cov_2.635741_2_plen_45_part_00
MWVIEVWVKELWITNVWITSVWITDVMARVNHRSAYHGVWIIYI